MLGFYDLDADSDLGSEVLEEDQAIMSSPDNEYRAPPRPTVVHTARISSQSDGTHICITGLSGEAKGAKIFTMEATIKDLEVEVKDMFQWTSVTVFNDAGIEAHKEDQLKDHRLLTISGQVPRFRRRRLDAAQQLDSTLPEVLSLELRGASFSSDDYSDLESIDDSYAEEDSGPPFSKYAKDPRRSQFVDSSTGVEVSPDDIKLCGVRSLSIKDAEVHLVDFDHIENCFPRLEHFAYSVARGYSHTYDLRGLANPLWSNSLKTLRLQLGPCHVCDGAYGLEVLGPLSNLEIFDLSRLRHASLKDLKVVEHFPALVELCFRGAIDDVGGDDESGSDVGVTANVALNLSEHLKLRKVEFEDYCSSSSFSAPGERCGIQLHLPFLGSSCSTSKSAGDVQKIELRLVHHGHSMFTKRLRDAVQQSDTYDLREFLLSGDYKAESVSSAKMNELWRKDLLEGAKLQQASCHSRMKHDVEARASIIEFFADEESVLQPSFFPPTKLFGLESKLDVKRWVEYSDLQPQRMQFEEGDRCFILALVGHRGYDSLDLLTGDWEFRYGSAGCYCSLSEQHGAIRSILRSTPGGSRGLFMAECQVQKRKLAARARLAELKCAMAAACFEEVVAQQHKEEHEYSVQICGSGEHYTLAGVVHESFLFSEIPSGWRSVEDVSMTCTCFDAGRLVFPISLLPDHILKGIPLTRAGPCRDLSPGHSWQTNGRPQSHKRRRTEDTALHSTEIT